MQNFDVIEFSPCKLKMQVSDFTYSCETAFNVSLHLQVNGFSHVHFAVLRIPFKYWLKIEAVLYVWEWQKEKLSSNLQDVFWLTFAKVGATSCGQDFDEDGAVLALPPLSSLVQSPGITVNELLTDPFSPASLCWAETHLWTLVAFLFFSIIPLERSLIV